MIEVTLSDIDFYERKIKTLEEDNIYLHEQIMKLRARLRTAQDYQIKYSLLLSSSQREMDKFKTTVQKQQESKRQELLSTKLKQNDEKWKSKFQQFQLKLKTDTQLQLQQLKKDIAEKNQSLQSLKERSEQVEIFGFKMNKMEKQNQNLKEEIEQMREFYQKKGNQQIAKLRLTLNSSYRQRIEAQKKKYETKIVNLQNRLTQLQIRDDNTTFKVSDATNRELISLKQLLEEKSREYSQQLLNLRNSLQSKNQQIAALLKQTSQNDVKSFQKLNDKNEYIKNLEDKILEGQKQHEIELLNLVQRMNSAKQEEHRQLSNQIKKLNEEISRANLLWSEKILNHSNEIEEINRKFEDEKRKLSEQKNMHKRKLSELSLKARQIQGERQIGETQMLINSIRDMDVKEENINSYENGITFLERMFKKCQIKLDEKSRTVSKLYKDINDIRAEADQQISELKQKMKRDRKQNTDRILLLQNQLRELQDKHKAKDRQDRKRERQLHKQKNDLQQKVKALKQFNEELTRDYNRVIQDKKGVQSSYRQEREKSFTSKVDVNIIKKQKWLQLEKQKNELQIIFKEKQEQQKLKYEEEIDGKVNQLNKIKQEFQICQKQNELLRKDNQKLMQKLEIDKENLKTSQYNKKIASLNLQLALTQNIYESLVKAKSRVNNPHSPSSQVDINFRFEGLQQEHDNLFASFHPSATKK